MSHMVSFAAGKIKKKKKKKKKKSLGIYKAKDIRGTGCAPCAYIYIHAVWKAVETMVYSGS